jgi:hypothetical protein
VRAHWACVICDDASCGASEIRPRNRDVMMCLFQPWIDGKGGWIYPGGDRGDVQCREVEQ